ncbi:ATP-binding protein [Streptomyces sp. MJP52]|uniref:sensor histidine kinase n=1 Tax=Streptomyces sp. MJP52 TaxID=2940555 RepID=UPI002472F95A|nr:ATP-binding protein [Streptomyces sp. MJP52]MDH6227389.1 signal transduction histidine kinase [Streptomyces sp. MJP52]
MSVPVPPGQQDRDKAFLPSPAACSALLVVTAAAGAAAAAAAPPDALPWILAVGGAAWVVLGLTVLVGRLLALRAVKAVAARQAESARAREQAERLAAQVSHLLLVTLPALTDDPHAALDLDDPRTLPDPQLRRLAHAVAATVGRSAQRAAVMEAEYLETRAALDGVLADLEMLRTRTLPAAVGGLREGRSADTVLADVELPAHPVVRATAEESVRALAVGERRAAAAQAASAKALGRVQAKAVQMLADLREMQERHGEEVFGDLLKLDHSTSQLGLMTDRLALLMGGRSSRAWNKPIVMESILRGAVGRIAAYRRVRLHCSTTAAISGHAAEGVMHLLAELMDNAANFSPPIDEVHVYAEHHSAGIVVTVEDSGLRMAEAAMRRAEEAVQGRVTDLASLQGTRVGLAVVGRIAVKHGISVNYRPSSRGGTGVVVLLPLHLLAQRREPVTHDRPVAAVSGAAEPGARPVTQDADGTGHGLPGTPRRPGTAGRLPVRPAQEPAAQEPAARAARPEPDRAPRVPEQGGRRRDAASTANGLPVRAPGRTMADAEREREQRRGTSGPAGGTRSGRGSGHDAGARFGAFHRARRPGGETAGPGPADPEPPVAP